MSAMAGIGGLISGIGGALNTGMGQDQTTATSGVERKVGGSTSQLELEQEAINKIISDVLGSEQGLAAIMSGEQGAGIFNSSAAAQASGDLITNLVGEIAKLTGKQVNMQDLTTATDTTTDVTSEGWLRKLGFEGALSIGDSLKSTKNITIGDTFD